MKKSNIILGGLVVIGVSIWSYHRGRANAIEELCEAMVTEMTTRVASKKKRPEYCLSRQDAEKTLSAMQDIIDSYGFATVADFKDLTGVQSTITDNRYGWTDLEGTTIKNILHGYRIDLPFSKYLK